MTLELLRNSFDDLPDSLLSSRDELNASFPLLDTSKLFGRDVLVEVERRKSGLDGVVELGGVGGGEGDEDVGRRPEKKREGRSER